MKDIETPESADLTIFDGKDEESPLPGQKMVPSFMRPGYTGEDFFEERSD